MILFLQLSTKHVWYNYTVNQMVLVSGVSITTAEDQSGSAVTLHINTFVARLRY